MQRLLLIYAIGATAFGIATASAATLGSGSLSPGQLSAANATIEDCGNVGSPTLGYETANNGSLFVVAKVILTATSGSFTNSPSCVGSPAVVNFGSTQVFSGSLTSGDFTNAGATLTIDVTDTAVGLVSNFSILVK